MAVSPLYVAQIEVRGPHKAHNAVRYNNMYMYT